jgi:type IX secretion system PorP/SprF family membrane protein
MSFKRHVNDLKQKVNIKMMISSLKINQNLLKIRILFFGLLLVVSILKVEAQQEPMYSQYMFNMLQINPAYAGNRAVDNITNLYRKQWIGIPNSPSTAALSWDKRKEDSSVGYGLQIYNDRLGVESSTGIQAFYSYKIPFEKSSLTFGLSGGALYYYAAFSQVTTVQSGDPVFQEDVRGILPTAGFGLLYSAEKWYVGLSAPALLKTKIISSYNVITSEASNHYFLTGGYIYNVSSVLKLKPSVMVKAVSGAPIEYDLNLNAWLNDVVGLGVSYRTNDAFVGMFELQISPEIRLGYAYDYTISNLKTYSKGTHELLLRYEFGNPKVQRILSPRYY